MGFGKRVKKAFSCWCRKFLCCGAGKKKKVNMHGDRTPDNITSPNDPYKGTFSPRDWGESSINERKSMQQVVKLGHWHTLIKTSGSMKEGPLLKNVLYDLLANADWKTLKMKGYSNFQQAMNNIKPGHIPSNIMAMYMQENKGVQCLKISLSDSTFLAQQLRFEEGKMLALNEGQWQRKGCGTICLRDSTEEAQQFILTGRRSPSSCHKFCLSLECSTSYDDNEPFEFQKKKMPRFEPGQWLAMKKTNGNFHDGNRKNPCDAVDIRHGTFKGGFNFTLPGWNKSDKVREVVFRFSLSTDERVQMKLKAGPLLDQILQDLLAKAGGKGPKMNMLCSFAQLGNCQHVMNVWPKGNPFNIMAITELLQNKGVPSLKIILRDSAEPIEETLRIFPTVKGYDY